MTPPRPTAFVPPAQRPASHRMLSPSLFWDVDSTTFNFQKGRRLVVQRVLTMGTLEDLQMLKTLYPLSEIKEEVLRISDWAPQVRNFISIWLDLPKERLACCTSRH